jgi:ABC-type amino acid transport substrate-binding protein
VLFRSKPAFEPYEVIGADGLITGVHPDMLARLGRSLGLRLRPVVFDSFPAALDAARARDVDILMSIGVTGERTEFLEFTLGATPMVSALFARQGQAVDPARARFVVPQRNMAGEFVRRQYPAAQLTEARDSDAALDALAKGGADYFVANLLPTLERIERLHLNGIEVRRLVQYGTGHYHFAVRKDWAPLARILNKGIATIRQEPPRELAAALQGLPQSVERPQTASLLAERHRAALIEKPVWRVGAVRGLSLLNDFGPNGRPRQPT